MKEKLWLKDFYDIINEKLRKEGRFNIALDKVDNIIYLNIILSGKNGTTFVGNLYKYQEIKTLSEAILELVRVLNMHYFNYGVSTFLESRLSKIKHKKISNDILNAIRKVAEDYYEIKDWVNCLYKKACLLLIKEVKQLRVKL